MRCDLVYVGLPWEGHPMSSYIGRQPWPTDRFPSMLVGYNMKGLLELF
jgi:hypothetical protein